MFEKNVGPTDRGLRILAGVAMVTGGFWVGGTAGIAVGILGFVPLFTGLFGSCPAYSLFKVNTCPLEKFDGHCAPKS